MAAACSSPPSSSSLPPPYSPSTDSPSYSALPRDEEICLTRTARAHARAASRVLVLDHESKTCPFSVGFNHQNDDCDVCGVPGYQRGDVVDGYIELHNANATVVSVSVKLVGQTQLSSGSGGKHTFPFMQYNFELWRQDTPDSAAPSRFDFAIPLPTHVTDDGEDRPLPSSTRALFQGPSAAVEYLLKISVSTKGLGGIFNKSHVLSTPIVYVHRSHPPQPQLGCDQSFMSTVKVAPEEWTLSETTIPQRGSATVPLRCTIAVPASRIFAVSSPIPFHIQLTGSPSALRHFLHSNTDSFSADSSRSSSSRSLARLDPQTRGRSHSPGNTFSRHPSAPTPHARASSLSSSALYYMHGHAPTSNLLSPPQSPYASPLSSPSGGRTMPLPSPASSRSTSPARPLPPPDDEGLLRISLHRRVTVSVLGERTWRVQKLSSAAHLELVHAEPDAGWLAWKGAIVPSMLDHWAPACQIGGLGTVDYISLEVGRRGGHGHAGDVLPHSHAIAVKLVTDPFPDDNVVTDGFHRHFTH